MPARAMSAAATAITAYTPFRLTQGTSTRPATGSQARPRVFFSASAAASAHCWGEPPITSVSAAAAMAAAVPHSAWQPPAAPEMVALVATTPPMPEAVSSP